MKFLLTSETIIPPQFSEASAGAKVVFEGVVRNSHKGREVVQLEYESYNELAISEGEQLVSEAIAKYELIDALTIHRIGTLTVGEVAVWIGVLSPHRKNAFLACEFIIDELKLRIPIWKKEHYREGDSGWIEQQF